MLDRIAARTVNWCGSAAGCRSCTALKAAPVLACRLYWPAVVLERSCSAYRSSKNRRTTAADAKIGEDGGEDAAFSASHPDATVYNWDYSTTSCL